MEIPNGANPTEASVSGMENARPESALQEMLCYTRGPEAVAKIETA